MAFSSMCLEWNLDVHPVTFVVGGLVWLGCEFSRFLLGQVAFESATGNGARKCWPSANKSLERAGWRRLSGTPFVPPQQLSCTLHPLACLSWQGGA